MKVEVQNGRSLNNIFCNKLFDWERGVLFQLMLNTYIKIIKKIQALLYTILKSSA